MFDGHQRLPVQHTVMILALLCASMLVPHLFALGQHEDTTAIAPPFLDKTERTDWDGSVQLKSHRVVVFLYQNAALIYNEDQFVYSGSDSVVVDVSLPSTGYTMETSEGAQLASKGLFGLRIWVDDERRYSDVVSYGDDLWYTINPVFYPNRVTKVRALFWMPTTIGGVPAEPSLDSVTIAPGKRTLVILYSRAARWQDRIEKAQITVVAKEKLAAAGESVSAFPEDFASDDSTWTWTRLNIEPTLDDDIMIAYDTSKSKQTSLDTMASLSAYILTRGFDELLEFATEREEQ